MEGSTKEPSSITKLRCLVNVSSSIVVLTGAGVSTESNIPDFRSPDGIWSRYRIIQYHEFMRDEESRIEDWQRRFAMDKLFCAAKPNIGHKILASWANSGKCAAIITQNIDGLHQMAGAPDDKVVEIHGTARHAKCTHCGRGYEISSCQSIMESEGVSPRCVECDGIIKSAVIMFGEKMPEISTNRAFEKANQADLFIAIGTSLEVYPAALLPEHARKAGAKLVIINRQRTEQDEAVDLVVRGEIGQVLSSL